MIQAMRKKYSSDSSNYLRKLRWSYDASLCYSSRAPDRVSGGYKAELPNLGPTTLAASEDTCGPDWKGILEQ